MLELRDDLTLSEIDEALARTKRLKRQEIRLIAWLIILSASELLMLYTSGSEGFLLVRIVIALQAALLMVVTCEWNNSNKLIALLTAAKERLEKLDKIKRQDVREP